VFSYFPVLEEIRRILDIKTLKELLPKLWNVYDYFGMKGRIVFLDWS